MVEHTNFKMNACVSVSYTIRVLLTITRHVLELHIGCFKITHWVF